MSSDNKVYIVIETTYGEKIVQGIYESLKAAESCMNTNKEYIKTEHNSRSCFTIKTVIVGKNLLLDGEPFIM